MLHARRWLTRPARSLGEIVSSPDDAARPPHDLNGIVHPLVHAHIAGARGRRRGRPESDDLRARARHPPAGRVAAGTAVAASSTLSSSSTCRSRPRVLATGGLTGGCRAEQAAARMGSRQATTRQQRLAIADIVIDNSGTLAGPRQARQRGLCRSCGSGPPGRCPRARRRESAGPTASARMTRPPSRTGVSRPGSRPTSGWPRPGTSTDLLDGRAAAVSTGP